SNFPEITGGNTFDGCKTCRRSVFALMRKRIERLVGPEIARKKGVAQVSVDPEERRLETLSLKRGQCLRRKDSVLTKQLRHTFYRRYLENSRRRKFLTEDLLDLRQQIQRRQRVSSELEKVIRHADPGRDEYGFPNVRKLQFSGVSRRDHRVLELRPGLRRSR